MKPLGTPARAIRPPPPPGGQPRCGAERPLHHTTTPSSPRHGTLAGLHWEPTPSHLGRGTRSRHGVAGWMG